MLTAQLISWICIAINGFWLAMNLLSTRRYEQKLKEMRMIEYGRTREHIRRMNVVAERERELSAQEAYFKTDLDTDQTNRISDLSISFMDISTCYQKCYFPDSVEIEYHLPGGGRMTARVPYNEFGPELRMFIRAAPRALFNRLTPKAPSEPGINEE